MRDSKHKRSKHRSSRPLSIKAFPAELEAECRQLYKLVACGAEPLLLLADNPRERLAQAEFRRQFYCAAHQGFQEAQERIIQSFSSPLAISPTKQLLLRKTIDTAAWQMINHQLYVPRRLYREKRQPSVLHSNLESLRQAAAQVTSDDCYRIALLSDLTTFVQVGDLLTMDPDQGIGIVEVKEGAVNAKLLEFSDFLVRQ